jgi:hypothetical protein
MLSSSSQIIHVLLFTLALLSVHRCFCWTQSHQTYLSKSFKSQRNACTSVQHKHQNISSATRLSPTSSSSQNTEVVSQNFIQDKLHMGISKQLNELPIGQSIVHQNIQTIHNKEEQKIQITKLSQKPPIFHLKGILSQSECDYIIQNAQDNELFEQATTRIGGIDNDKRKNCQVAWLSNFKYEPIARLAESIQGVFLPFEPLPLHLDYVEEMQVVKYDKGGEFQFHHDGARRLLTVIYYLNGVSETWFPLANLDHHHVTSYDEGMDKVNKLMNDNNKNNEREGVLVTSNPTCNVNNDVPTIQTGDAIAFYNYYTDASPAWDAIHAGLPAKKSKWIGTHWYHHVPSSLRNSNS